MVGGLHWSEILSNKNLSNEDILLLDEYDKKVYLSQLKLLCDGMLPAFRQEMQQIHSNHMNFALLKVAPVKKMSRATEKIGTDYHDESKFPKSARIVDMLRCSLTFDDVEKLVDGVTTFQGIVESNETENGFTQIMRIKNGLMDNHDGYKDVKLNVVFGSAEFGKSVITEIQFILKDFLQVKKEQHRTYSIIRKQDVFRLVDQNTTSDFTDRLIFNGARFGPLNHLFQIAVFPGKQCQW